MKAKKLVSSTGGAPGVRSRRDEQRGTPVDFPVTDRAGRIGVQVDPRGAIGTDPARGLNVRVGDGLGIQSSSPFAVVPLLGTGLELSGGKIVPRLSSSVKTNVRGQLVATPSASDVTEPTDGTVQASIDRIGAQLATLSAITADGDKGDVVVSGSGAVWAFDSGVVTAAGRAILDDADAAAQRTTLGIAIGTDVGAPPIEAYVGPLYCTNIVHSTALTTAALLVGTLYAIPLFAPGRGGVLDRFGAEITTLAALGTAHVGIYSPTSATDPYPNAILIDAGTISTAAVAMVLNTISQALSPSAMYYGVIEVDLAASVRGANNQHSVVLGYPSTGGASPHWGYTVARAFAALPATFPAGAALQTAAPRPVLHYRFSA